MNVTILKGQENVQILILPPVQDSYPSEKHTVFIKDIPPWMYLDPYKKIIYVRANDFPRDKLGMMTFDLTLSDKSGLSTKYFLNIDFYEDIWKEPEVSVAGLVQKSAPEYSYNGLG